MLLRCVVAICGILLFASARAGVVTYSDSHTPSVADISTTLNVQLFNLADAALDRVIVTLEADMQVGAIGTNVNGSTHSGLIANSSNRTQRFRLSLASSLTATSTSATPGALAAAVEGASLDLGTDASLLRTVNAGSSVYFDGTAAHITTVTGNTLLLDTDTLPDDTSAADLAKFVGADTLSLHVQSFTSLSAGGGGGNLNWDIGTFIGAKLSVAYYYHDVQNPLLGGMLGDGSPVPEPGTACLLLGVAGIAFSRRRPLKLPI